MAGGAGDVPDAFSVVGDESRAAILRALVDYRGEHPDEEGMSFMRLKERSGIEDKGNFNYHLDKLVGQFVEKTDDGYRLTGVGGKMAGVLLSGEYSDRVERVTVGHTCPTHDCDAELVVHLQAGWTSVRCTDDHPLFEIGVPPGTVEAHDPEDLLSIAAFYSQQVADLHAHGVCVECFGREVGELERVEQAGQQLYCYHSRCSRCGFSFRTPPGAIVARHPAVVSLYHDHGVDIRDEVPWALTFYTWSPKVLAEDPLRLRVTAKVGADSVHLDLDRGGDVVAVDEQR
jgi:hypothetical protein